MEHTVEEFEVRGSWTGGLRTGRGELGADGMALSHSAPSGLGGLGVGTNPEELLCAAANSCVLMTLAGILESRGVLIERAHCRTVTQYAVERSGPQLASVVHEVTLQGAIQEVDLDRLAAQVEKGCMVSRALTAEVRVTVRDEAADMSGVHR